MVQVPIIQQDIQTRALPAPVLGASLRPFDDPYVKNNGAANLAKAVSGVADDIFAKQKARDDKLAALEVQKKLDDWEAQNIFDPANGALMKKGKDAFNLPKEYAPLYEKYSEEITKDLTDDQQLMARDMAQSRQRAINSTLQSHARQEYESVYKATADAAVDSGLNRAALNWNNPELRTASIEHAKSAQLAYLQEQGMPEDVIAEKLMEVEGKGHFAILNRMADADPKAAIEYYNQNQGLFGGQLDNAQKLISPTERKYKAVTAAKNALSRVSPQASRDEVIQYTIDVLEGGEKIVPDGKGSVAKYGINSNANSDMYKDGKTPTEAEAKQRLVDKYWNKIDADNLPPEMRLPAFAFAMNHGTEDGLADRLIDEANGDPMKLIELQAQFYQDLARKNPDEHAKNLNGWMNRLGQIKGQVEAMRGAMPDEVQLYAQVDSSVDDIRVADDAKQIISKQLTDQKQAIAAREKEAADEVFRYENAGMDVPVSVLAKLSPEKQQAFYAKNYDPMEYERVRAQVSVGQPVDIDAIRFRISPAQYDDLVKMQGDPVLQVMARSVDKHVNSAALKVTGKARAKIQTKEDFQQLDNYRQNIYKGITAFERTTGKKPTPDEIAKIADDLIMKPSTGWTSSTPKTVKIEGIPEGRAFMIGGDASSYEDVVALASRKLRENNIPVTPENVSGMYKALVKKKLIVEKY